MKYCINCNFYVLEYYKDEHKFISFCRIDPGQKFCLSKDGVYPTKIIENAQCYMTKEKILEYLNNIEKDNIDYIEAQNLLK